MLKVPVARWLLWLVLLLAHIFSFSKAPVNQDLSVKVPTSCVFCSQFCTNSSFYFSSVEACSPESTVLHVCKICTNQMNYVPDVETKNDACVNKESPSCGF